MSHGTNTNHIYIRRRGTDTGQRRSINGFSRGCTYTAAKTSKPLRKSSKLAPLFRSFAVFYQKSPIFYDKEPCTLHRCPYLYQKGPVFYQKCWYPLRGMIPEYE